MVGSKERVRRLKWHCRRGMKELDILLERFINNQHHILAEGAWPEFESLLQVEDDLLWDWLQNPSLAQAQPFRKLLDAIRYDQG